MLRMIESTLESPWSLHVIMGYGVLPKVAHYYSRLLIMRVTANDVGVFRTLLTQRPEFREQFRAATFDGVAGNPLTILGNSIPQLDRTGCEYIFEEED
ncbi:hypothetical protein PRIPAC_79627 [Pristionchus pacificus]|uniref:Uncharacterized protein n=1 Tax=Pristionchus pacificus TaxID=54126 RepID=A0A454Y0K0_PRIPA|nr:hypothetical protein PRIPAC_79627 [Pristionchus pacificus]|eukprot:PDM65474.1 hypothetical protein PRIPAC_52416 [Pristionchus pacificus]